MSAIELKGASLGYGRRAVLREVTCSIARGGSLGLVGPNGAGKTTFLRSVLGLLPPLAGTVRTEPGLRFAYVPQADELNTLWPLSVRDAVALACRARRPFGRLLPEEERAVREAMEQGGVSALASKPLSELSGGQRQRTVIAQALAQRPDVLLLDEPTRGLDVVAERDILSLVRALRERRRLTVLLVTHTLAIPLNHSERILLFHDGRVADTTPEALVGTDLLRELYGIPFERFEQRGLRWALPKGP